MKAKFFGYRRKPIVVLLITCVVSVVFPVISGISAADASSENLTWKSCPPGAEGLPDAGQKCATLRVPLDHQQPNGQKIEIAISRIKSTGKGERRGVLLANPGGPGESGIDMPRILSLILPPEILDHYDIVGFDPRFIGTSSPITCGLNQTETKQAFVPLAQPGGFSKTAEFMKNIAEKCEKNAGDKLSFANTSSTAKDIDKIRQALGERKISYLGYSYGTYLGAAYSSLFPNRTDRFILDSSVDPNWVWREQFRSWGAGGQVRFPDFAKFAVQNESTYHLGKTQSEVHKLFYELVGQLDKNPLTLPDETILNGSSFRAFTFNGLYNDNYFVEIAQLWQLVKESASANKVGLAIRGLSADVSTNTSAAIDNRSAAALAIACSDAQWSKSIDQYKKELAIDSVAFPMFGPLGSNIWPCAFWKFQSKEKPVKIRQLKTGNVLVVQNLRDPATPYIGAFGMKAALGSRAHLLSVDQGGHGSYGLTPNNCATTKATSFLLGTNVHDSYCLGEAPPSPSASSKAPPENKLAVGVLLKRIHK